MSAQSHDELHARRVQHADRSGDHRRRMAYDSFADGLADADRVIDDLEAIGQGQLFVPMGDLDFTIRRLRTLVRGAMVSARQQGIR